MFFNFRKKKCISNLNILTLCCFKTTKKESEMIFVRGDSVILFSSPELDDD